MGDNDCFDWEILISVTVDKNFCSNRNYNLILPYKKPTNPCSQYNLSNYIGKHKGSQEKQEGE